MPVISIGNITVGGTGKTPHTEMLIEALCPVIRSAILSRGYKRKTKGFRYVEITDTTTQVGDEPLQMKRKFPDVTVTVDVDRIRGIQRMMREIPDLGVVVLDDAFQYRKVHPALSILMIDYNRPIQGDYLLPLGRLRDRVNQQGRADVLFVTKCPERLKPIDRRIIEKDMGLYPYQRLYFTTITYGDMLPVFEGCENTQESKEAIAITGIANPSLFIEQVKKSRELRAHLSFSDHHSFTKRDVKKINQTVADFPEAIVLTTEKDAMRLREISGLSEDVRQKLFFVPIGVKFIEETERDRFVKFIVNYVHKNKRNNILHPLN